MIFDPALEIRFLFFSGILCILMNGIAIFMIVFKSGNIGTYRNYLLYYQIVCFVLDIHITLLVVPTVYLPALLAVSHGFYSRWFSISTHCQINVVFILIMLQVCSLICSFIRKHQSVAAIGNKHVMPSGRKYLIKILLHLPPIFVAIFFGSANLDKQQETSLADDLFPGLVPLLNLSNSEMYSASSLSVQLTILSMILTFLVYALLFLYLHFQIIQMLHSHRQFMAAKTYAKHIAAMVSLVTQLTVLVLWIAVPILLLLADVLLNIEGMEAYCNALICLFSTHSIVSTLVMIFTFPAFRRVLFCQEKPLFSPGTTVAPRAFAKSSR